jgi:hypothetical protein
MRDDEIILNRWCADALAAAPGDRVALSFSLPLPGGGFEERERAFTVRAVLPMERVAAEAALVPEFPGLTDVERCRGGRIRSPAASTPRRSGSSSRRRARRRCARSRAPPTSAGSSSG